MGLIGKNLRKMDEYRSDYKGKIFGVKRIQNFFAVEEANVFGDLTKYDFLLKDSCIYSYNGNHTYQAVIMTEACEEPIFNGWKIENLVFPGNWYGNWSAFNLIDRFGEKYASKQFGKQQWYDKQTEVMLRETLLEVLKFTETHYSVKNDEVIKGFDVPTGTISLQQYHDFNDKVSQYIEDYQKALTSLQSSGADEEKITQLKQLFDAQIRKCYPFSIEV